MRHILTFQPSSGDLHEGKPLAALRQWTCPNLVVFSRSAVFPVTHLDADSSAENEETESDEDSVSGTKRALRGMSVKSSLNVARVLSTLDWVRLGRCLHVTLTYWKNWPGSKAEIALVKQALAMWFSRNCECGIWRLEFHQASKSRGFDGERVPHWHVLVWIGSRCDSEFGAAVRRWWAKGADGNDHREAVKVSDGDGRASYYLAMHAGKRDQAPPYAVGRWWGYINRKVLLSFQRFCEVGEGVQERERVWWSRLYRRRTGCKIRNAGGFSWFLDETSQDRVRRWVGERCDFEKATRSFGGRPF